MIYIQYLFVLICIIVLILQSQLTSSWRYPTHKFLIKDHLTSKLKCNNKLINREVQQAPIKAMIFVDGTWLFYSLRGRDNIRKNVFHSSHGNNWKVTHSIDWTKFPNSITKRLQSQLTTIFNQPKVIDIASTLVFTSTRVGQDSAPNLARDKLIDDLSDAQFDVRNYIETSNANQEKCVDIALASEMLYLASIPDAYDIAILVSGDKDYIPALEKIRLLGKKVAICSMRNACNKDLTRNDINIKDFDVVWFDDFGDEILIQKFEENILENMKYIISFLLKKVIDNPSGVSIRSIGGIMNLLNFPFLKVSILSEIKRCYNSLLEFFKAYPQYFMIEKGEDDLMIKVAGSSRKVWQIFNIEFPNTEYLGFEFIDIPEIVCDKPLNSSMTVDLMAELIYLKAKRNFGDKITAENAKKLIHHDLILFFTSYKTHIQFFSAFPHLYNVVFTNGGYECFLVSKNSNVKNKPLLHSALGELNEDIVTLQPLRYHHNQKIIPDPPFGYNDNIFGRIIAVILKMLNINHVLPSKQLARILNMLHNSDSSISLLTEIKQKFTILFEFFKTYRKYFQFEFTSSPSDIFSIRSKYPLNEAMNILYEEFPALKNENLDFEFEDYIENNYPLKLNTSMTVNQLAQAIYERARAVHGHKIYPSEIKKIVHHDIILTLTSFKTHMDFFKNFPWFFKVVFSQDSSLLYDHILLTEPRQKVQKSIKTPNTAEILENIPATSSEALSVADIPEILSNLSSIVNLNQSNDFSLNIPTAIFPPINLKVRKLAKTKSITPRKKRKSSKVIEIESVSITNQSIDSIGDNDDRGKEFNVTQVVVDKPKRKRNTKIIEINK